MPPVIAGLQWAPKGSAVKTYASKGGVDPVVVSFPKKWRLRLPWYIFSPVIAVAGAALPRAMAMLRSDAESSAPDTRVRPHFTKAEVWAIERIAADIVRPSLQNPLRVFPSWGSESCQHSAARGIGVRILVTLYFSTTYVNPKVGRSSKKLVGIHVPVSLASETTARCQRWTSSGITHSPALRGGCA